MTAVHKGAGEPNVSAEIRRLVGAVAAVSHLVLHRVHFLHRGGTGFTGGWPTDHKIWEVGVNIRDDLMKLLSFCNSGLGL